MFNICNPKTNGEEHFFRSIKSKIDVIFDVGCRLDSEFIVFKGEVHYFDPVSEFIDKLKLQKNVNKVSHFNSFGLGDKNEQMLYSSNHQSFCDRSVRSYQDQINIDRNISETRANEARANIERANRARELNEPDNKDRALLVNLPSVVTPSMIASSIVNSGKQLLDIKKGIDYVNSKNIKTIDFLKIDTEGYELNVLQGFDNFFENIKIIQFAYGGAFLDNKIKLKDVTDYLDKKGFHKYSYLSTDGPVLITDFTDHYKECNIVCINKNSTVVPY